MCGIAGFVGYRNSTPPQLLQRMVAALVHRGPDDAGFVDDAQGGIGMRRLAIVGLHNGRQPIRNEDGSWHIVGNGEIYNAPELKRQLEQQGHQFRTDSDIEVALHLFEDRGVDAFAQLNGMFALALRHTDGRTLIVRDRLGIKPLYYLSCAQGTLFASEIPALRVGVPSGEAHHLDIDPQAMHDFLRLGYIAAPRTMHRGVRQLAPGHYAWLRPDSVSASKVEVGCWWQLPDYEGEDPPRSVGSYSEELVELLRSSVKYRTLGDVQAGALLSGGLDSGSLVGLLSQSVDSAVPTFTLGFGDADNPDLLHDEVDDARITAKHFGCDHYVDRLTQPHYDDIAQLLRHYGEPFADVSLLATDRVAQLAAKRVKYVISGDGGDELFAGYSWLHREVRWRRLPAPLLGAARALEPMLGWGHRSRRANFVGKALRAMADIASPAAHSFLRRRSLCSASLVPQLLHPQLQDRVRYETPLERHVRDWRGNPWELMLDLDRRFYLSNDILAKVDRATMRHSLEARVPLLDHRIVEWAARIPVQTHLGSGDPVGKVIMRKSIEKLLPAPLLTRKKRGFGIPIDSWLRGPLYYDFEARLRSPEFRDRGWLDDAWVAQLLREHGSGHAHHGHLLWGLVSLAEWGTSLDTTRDQLGSANVVELRPRPDVPVDASAHHHDSETVHG